MFEMIDYFNRYNELTDVRNNIIAKNENLFKILNVSKFNKVTNRFDTLNDYISTEKNSIKTVEDEIVKIENSLAERFEVWKQCKPSRANDDLIPRCEICLELYDHNLHWHSCIVICGHQFGKSCLEKVLETNGRCPKCNKVFTADNIITLF